MALYAVIRTAVRHNERVSDYSRAKIGTIFSFEAGFGEGLFHSKEVAEKRCASNNKCETLLFTYGVRKATKEECIAYRKELKGK